MDALRVFEAEAARIRQILLDLPEASPLLNLGSSTRRFRETTKPHIEAELFKPLRVAGIEVVHSDLKAADGVDVAGDILDPEVRRALKARRFRCVLCSNVLEHVRDRAALAAACEELAGPGGHVLATAPSSYPFHADPIDTGFRPTPDELARIFTRSRIVAAEEVSGGTYGDDLRARGIPVWRAAADTVLLGLICFLRPKSFYARAHRWFWFNRPRRASIVLVVVETAPEAAR